jgi:hypothetical protein
MYPDEAVWDDARTSWLQSGQELQLIEWLSAALWLPVLLLREGRYATYDRPFFGGRAGHVVVAALDTIHTLVGAPPPPRRVLDTPEWLAEQDEADHRRCSLLLGGAPTTGENFLGALLEYLPGGRLARGMGQSETHAMAIACALAHHTPRALSDHAPLMSRIVSLLEAQQGESRIDACAGTALRCIGVGGLCQSRHAINRLLVEGSRPHPPVYILTALIRLVGTNRNSVRRVRCSYAHRWDSPSLLLPPGITPQHGREGSQTLGVERPEEQWKWLTHRVWNEDDEFAAAPVVVAFCAILAIGWSEPQTLLLLLATGVVDPKHAAMTAAAPPTRASAAVVVDSTPHVPFIVPSSLQMLLELLELSHEGGSGRLASIGAARVFSLLLSMATGTAPGVIGRQGSDRFWTATECESPLWTLLEILNKSAELHEQADLTDLSETPAAASTAGSGQNPVGAAPDGDSAGHPQSEAHKWAVHILWLWLRDVDVAARSAAQRQDLQPEFACGLASVEGVLEYLVRRAQGRSVAVAATQAAATYRECKTLLQHEGSSATTAAAIRREVDQREIMRMEERERLELRGTGSGVGAAMCMLIGLGRQCAACYKSCGGLLQWVEYAGHHDGRGRRPPAAIVEDCIDSLRRADFIWLAANQSMQTYLAEGEAEVRQVLRWRKRALKWINAARRNF